MSKDNTEGEVNLESECERLRGIIRDVGATVKNLRCHSCFKQDGVFPDQHSEMQANLMLSFRHLEDARMRLGKVMQQIQGGVSKFDTEFDRVRLLNSIGSTKEAAR